MGVVHRIDRAHRLGHRAGCRVLERRSRLCCPVREAGVPDSAAVDAALGHRTRSCTHLHLDETDRVHIDLWVNEGDSVESEVERLLALGAKRVDWEYSDDAQHVVRADPDGNLVLRLRIATLRCDTWASRPSGAVSVRKAVMKRAPRTRR